MDQGKGGEGGGREARGEAAAVVQADGGGLDQGDGMGLEMVRFWIYFTGSQENLPMDCRVKDNTKVGGIGVLCPVLGTTDAVGKY